MGQYVYKSRMLVIIKGNNSIILISCSKIVWKASKIFSLIQLVYTY